MPILRNAERAIVDERKVRDYLPVRTLWIIRTGEDVPRLISAYPIK
jgi:hypothetical protein